MSLVNKNCFRAFFTAVFLCFFAVLLIPDSGPAAVSKSGPGLNPGATLKTPENRELSPFTGYTRDHWLEITEKLIAGIMPYFDAETGLPDLKGVPGETGHFKEPFSLYGKKEALERSLMLVAFYTAATGKDRVPGYSGSISAPYLKGIIKGTDPSDPNFWGTREKYDAFGTNIALAALVSPRFFWDPLTEGQKDNLLVFFKGLVNMVAYDCNHWYFHLVGVPILERNGRDSNRDYLSMIFQRILNWYRGEGWFIDGGNFGFDYYNLWGFQLYNHVLCYFDEPWSKRFSGRIDEITELFQESYPYLYGRDGGSIPWGRSTTYRFASLAAIGWPVLRGASALDPGQARRIASGCLKYFWEHGAMSENGLLEPGFHGPNSVVAESYIDRGSPYWAAQGLCCLLVPEDHPFWTAPEKPMPADGAGGRIALPGAEMAIRVSPLDGEARLFPVGQRMGHRGQWQRGIKYCQHAYSSYLGYCALGEGGEDLGAGRTGTSFDGKRWHYRSRPRAIQVDTRHLISDYEIFVDTLDIALEDFGDLITHTLIGESGEVHVFWHNCARPIYLHLGGYGISVPHGGKLETKSLDNALVVSGGENHSVLRVLQGPPGTIRYRLLEPRPGWTHSHSFGGKGAFSYWRSDKPVPPNTPVAFYVDGTRSRPPAEPKISLRSHRDRLQVKFEGETYSIKIPL